MRVIVSPQRRRAGGDLVTRRCSRPKADALAAAPARAETLAREAADAARAADEAKKAAAAAAREVKPLAGAAAIGTQQGRAAAALRSADKALAAATTDEAKARRPRRGSSRRRKRPPTPRPRSTPPRPTRTPSAPRPPPPRTPPRPPTKQGRPPPSSRPRPGSRWSRCRSTSAAPRRRCTFAATPASRCRTAANCSTPRSSCRSTIRDPGKPIGTHVFTAMARSESGLRWSAVTIDAATTPRPRSTASPCRRRCWSGIGADRAAALLDRHLRRAAQRRDQLSHRIRRGAEPSAAGRLHHAPPRPQRLRRQRRRLGRQRRGLLLPAHGIAQSRAAMAPRPVRSPAAALVVGAAHHPLVMPALVASIHVLSGWLGQRRGWPGQARP